MYICTSCPATGSFVHLTIDIYTQAEIIIIIQTRSQAPPSEKQCGIWTQRKMDTPLSGYTVLPRQSSRYDKIARLHPDRPLPRRM